MFTFVENILEMLDQDRQIKRKQVRYSKYKLWNNLRLSCKSSLHCGGVDLKFVCFCIRRIAEMKLDHIQNVLCELLDFSLNNHPHYVSSYNSRYMCICVRHNLEFVFNNKSEYVQMLYDDFICLFIRSISSENTSMMKTLCCDLLDYALKNKEEYSGLLDIFRKEYNVGCANSKITK